MYDMRPARIYVMERAANMDACRPRIEGIVKAAGTPQVITITDEDVPEMIKANGLEDPTWWTKDYRQIPEDEDPILVLNAVRFDTDGLNETLDETLARCPEGTPRALVRDLLAPGCASGPTHAIRNGELICRSVHEFRLMYGCVHRCLYCELAGVPVVNVPLNVEEVTGRIVEKMVAEHPRQKVFRYQACASDSQCFEPECGATRAFVEFFARLQDRYLLIHTTSANLDHLLALDHKGHTIVVWSLTGETVSRDMEKRAGSTAERIEVARRCQEAGYTVRFKFKPIIPVRNWRSEARHTIRHLFAATRPDVVSMCCLMWFTPEELERPFDLADFDPRYIQAMRESANEMAGHASGPFPHWVRAEIYSFFVDEIRKVAPSVPISLSTETREMWREFSPRLGFGPNRFVCGCGPRCTPGLKILGEDALEEELRGSKC